MNQSLIAALLFGSAFLSQAQTTSPAPSATIPAVNPSASARVDPEKEKLIKSVLERRQEVEMVQERLRQVMEGMRAAMPRVPEKYFEKYRSLISLDEMRDRLVAVYDKHFTVEELKALLQVYDSPAGKKMTQETVPILRESMDIAQQMSKRAMGVSRG